MTGQINVNKIAARTGNTITIDTGDVLDITLVKSEGSANTNLKQGLIKAWMNLNGSGTIALRDSFNVSGVVDNGGGNYTKSLTNNMAATHSSGTAGSACSNTAYSDRSVSVLATATSSFQVNTGQDYTVNRADSLYTQTLAAGDLA